MLAERRNESADETRFDRERVPEPLGVGFNKLDEECLGTRGLAANEEDASEVLDGEIEFCGG